MARILLKILLVVLMLAAGVAIGMGYGLIQVRKERSAFQAEIDQLGQKAALLQEKYSEKKAVADGLLRAKRTLEGQQRTAVGEAERLQKEKESVVAQAEALGKEIEKSEATLASFKKRIEELSRENASAKATWKETEGEYVQRLKDHEGEIQNLKAEINGLTSQLKRANQKIDLCETSNAKLCIIAEELVETYRNKGVGDAILKKEPLIQFKKVELEQFLQEYRERIDEEKLKQTRE